MTTPDITPAAPRLNRRQASKLRTRERVLKAARDLFLLSSYQATTIRAVAKAAGMSTGAVFATVEDKAQLWREAMGTEPPLDTMDNPAIRAAPLMQAALRALLAIRPRDWAEGDDPAFTAAWTAAEQAYAASLPTPDPEAPAETEAEERKAA